MSFLFLSSSLPLRFSPFSLSLFFLSQLVKHTHQPVLGPARVLRLVRKHDRRASDAEQAVGDQHRALVAEVPVLGDVLLRFVMFLFFGGEKKRASERGV